ncbi:MAG: hypothetical protein QNJ36_17800 [Calothrix sp. MO_167.B42]|nr:hypothetical protein [Calothrix sp. MO_167.B42]
MTSRITEIQTLIADIDSLLTNKNNLLSRFISTQEQEAKVVLERTREFLARLEEAEAQADNFNREYGSRSPRSPLLAQFADREGQLGDKPLSHYMDVSALLQPLQAELQALLQERANLVQEIRQLEQKRLHNYSVAQQMENQEQMISEFLHVLMNRMEGKLSLDSGSNESRPSSEEPSAIAEQVDHLSQLTNDLERRLAALDGSVNIAFTGLERNVSHYHDSLSQAITRMHSKGVEGEQLLVALINNLTGVLQQKRSLGKSNLDVQPENLPIEPSLSTKGEYEHPDDLALNIDRELSSRELFDTSEFEDSFIEQGYYPPTGEDQQITPESDVTIPSNFADGQLVEELSPSDVVINTTSLGLDHHNANDSVDDRVDQLYASLFGSEDENISEDLPAAQLELPQPNGDNLPNINPNPETTSTQEIPPSPLDSPELTTTNVSHPASEEANQLQPVDTSLDEAPDNSLVTDMWFDRPDAGLLGNSPIHTAIPQELTVKNHDLDVSINTDKESPIDISSPQTAPEPTTTDAPEETPQSSITTLTDLFVDTAADTESTATDTATDTENVATENSEIDGTSQDFPDDPHQDNYPVPENNNAQSLVSDTESGYLEKSLEDYILASPQENLLTETVNTEAAMPKITLGEEHLQQFTQDLNQFGGNFNSPEQSQLDGEPEPIIAEVTPTIEAQQVVNDGNQTASSTTDVAVATPTNHETTTNEQSNSSLSVFNLINTPDITVSRDDGVWYLGIDLGSTGISAALLNRSTTEVYPIYWSAEEHSDPNSPGSSFRLPAEVYLPTNTIEKQPELSQEASSNGITTPPESLQNLFSAQLKPYLQVALPYKNQQQQWEPSLELNEYSTVPLVWVMRSLSKLLLTLKSDRTSTTPGLVAAAVGINEQRFHQIINQIAGVICNCPANSSEQYRFNLREALITGKIVQHPQQVFFIEEAIANVLAQLDDPSGEPIKFSAPTVITKENYPLEGSTLIINIGAGATEMALIDVPNNLLDLAHNDFMLHSFAYAGKGIEQDIICQLLLPEKWRESRLTTPESHTISSNPWHWQTSIPGLEQMAWDSIRLTELKLPRSGEPDTPQRIRLQQRLESSLLGKAVLDAAVALKLILQHQESFTLELADQRWILQRRDLESQVFVPFVRRLNRELNKLLVARGIPTEAINQAILTGGVASITAVNRWLRQKLPNAKIIQDPYLGENGTPTCSRTAYGLALLPLHPQVLDIPRQQYTDYFLFTELLRLLPDRAVSLSEITQLFEGRGINTRICQQRLLAFLEGELPSGLLPSTTDYYWLTQSSQENSFYKQLAAAPLFEKQGSLTYRPNSQQIKSLLTYLDAIKGSTKQSLEEPYTVNFALGVSA